MSSELSRARLVVTTLLAVGLAAQVACQPKYPRCDSDDACREHGEVCLDGQCQECRDDAGCEQKYPGQGRTCHDGRCDVATPCHADADCTASAAGPICRDGHCGPACRDAADCGAGQICAAGRCVTSCHADADCPGGHCVAGQCQAGAAAASDHGDATGCHGPDGSLALEPVHFGLNRFDLDADLRVELTRLAACLRTLPAGQKVVVEGHGDDRGTQEYNLALGEKRAHSVVQFLRSQGVPERALTARSKGENEPLCTTADEACWAMNRRVQFLTSQP